MSSSGLTKVLDVIRRDQTGLIADWAKEMERTGRFAHTDRGSMADQSAEFVSRFTEAAAGGVEDISASAWSGVREFLENLSSSRTLAGSSPSEIAGYILSFKRPLFARLKTQFGSDTASLTDATWVATDVIDELALFTTEVFQRSREGIIQRQQQDMLELSTPVVKLWDGVLALPMIGTLDSGRTQVVMESLLQRIVETGAEIAILDITGVPTVDTLVAQHLLKTVTAARLMGADCIISGIRPQIAQTIVHLGVDLQDVITKATMADAFALALRRKGLRVTRVPRPPLAASQQTPR